MNDTKLVALMAAIIASRILNPQHDDDALNYFWNDWTDSDVQMSVEECEKVFDRCVGAALSIMAKASESRDFTGEKK